MPALEPQIETPAQAAKRKLTGLSAFGWSIVLQSQQQGIEALWHDPNATPQEICDELGDKAVQVFDDHARLTDYIVAQLTSEGKNPLDYIALPTFAFTRNQDGTVTIGTDPYVPS